MDIDPLLVNVGTNGGNGLQLEHHKSQIDIKLEKSTSKKGNNTMCPKYKIKRNTKQKNLHEKGESGKTNIKNENSMVGQIIVIPDITKKKEAVKELPINKQLNGKVKIEDPIRNGKAQLGNQSSYANEMPKCYECGLSTNSLKELRKHIKTSHIGQKRKKCRKCKYFAFDEASLKNHRQTIHPKVEATKKYKCSYCDYCSRIRCTLENHIANVHNKVKNYCCSYCDFSSFWLRNMIHHTEHVHFKVKSYNCLYCNYTASRRFALNRHVKSRHMKKELSEEEKIAMAKHKCCFCDHVSRVKTNLKVHIEAVHLKNKKYLCDECGYTAAQKDAMRRHISALHNLRFECEHCNMRFKRRFQLKKHMEYH